MDLYCWERDFIASVQMGMQWQGGSVSLVYLPFLDEGRVEEVLRQKIRPAPLPFDYGGSDSHWVAALFIHAKVQWFWSTCYTALQRDLWPFPWLKTLSTRFSVSLLNSSLG